MIRLQVSRGSFMRFMRFFWKNLGYFIPKSTTYSFTAKRLPEFQTVGVISLLPKGDKSKEFLDNWRRISMQNSIYKLINSVLPSIIRPDQIGFVKGHYIGDCNRNTYDIMQ